MSFGGRSRVGYGSRTSKLEPITEEHPGGRLKKAIGRVSSVPASLLSLNIMSGERYRIFISRLEPVASNLFFVCGKRNSSTQW